MSMEPLKALSPFTPIVASGPRSTWDVADVRLAIFPEHTVTIAKEWGIVFTGKISGKGWMECHSIERKDDNPSAAIQKSTGIYRDQGTDGKGISFFDLGLKLGAYKSFPEMVNALGERFNVTPKSGNPRIGAATPLNGKPGIPGIPDTELQKTAKNKGKTPSKESQTEIGTPSLKKFWQTLSDAIGAASWAGKYNNTWMYNDSFAVARFESSKGKKVLPFHRDPTTNVWINGDPSGMLPLYRLDKLRSSGAVLVLEGEKCADLAGDLGYSAVTSSHGAQSAAKSDWSPLAGRDVVILPDADKGGAAYARDVTAILRGLDPTTMVRVLDLPGLEPESGDDIAEWLENIPDSWTPEQVPAELDRLIAAIPAVDLDAEAKAKAEADRVARWASLGLKCVEEFEETPIDWLWQDKILMGMLNLIVGPGDVGKSFLCLDMIARLTTGRAFPDQVDPKFPPCRCVYVTAEDRIGMAIRPRLRALGADQSKVFTLGTGYDENGKAKEFTIADIPWLDGVLAELPGTKLIVLDPIASFYGKVDENSNSELRALLKPLGDFAERHNVAIVAISHFGKGNPGQSANKILGSVALPNVARAVWCVVKDVDDEERRKMLRVKLNLSGKSSGLAYRITPELKIEWEPDAIDDRADDAVAESNPSRRESRSVVKKEQIMDAMLKVLADGPMKSDDIWPKMPKGMSRSTYFRLWPKEERNKLIRISVGSDDSYTWTIIPQE